MESFLTKLTERSKNKKGEYILLYQRRDNYGIWNNGFESHDDKDLAIEEYKNLLDKRNHEDYRNVRFICPINMEPILKFIKVSKQMEKENGQKKI